MSKKTNPTSLRIGNQLQWVQVTQNYNFKNITQTCIFTKVHSIASLFSQPTTSSSTFLNKLKIKTTPINHKLFFHLYSKSPQKIPAKITTLIPTNEKNLKSNNYIYNSSCFSVSAHLLTRYALFLFASQVPLRKILTLLNTLLLNNLKRSKVVSSKLGAQNFYLKGFSLSISGRFENSSTQMSKTLKQTMGNLPLVTLENYVEFSSTPIFFKLGKCNLKVWLFYSKTM